ncbi:jg11405 [Pararge aegeria aegeria]|uniref:Jg11405 protein n=1 Tax=Pararge aegeria aegeria TaxID=348720 RepID=A0A8S4RFF6_9NEOP|nr:jg11405 [Pararge aegeria aegeria]
MFAFELHTEGTVTWCWFRYLQDMDVLLGESNPRPWTQKAGSLPTAPIGRQNVVPFEDTAQHNLQLGAPRVTYTIGRDLSLPSEINALGSETSRSETSRRMPYQSSILLDIDNKTSAT